jgi:hypothetical protein
MNCLPILDVSINDDLGFDIELGSLARNTKKEVCGVINSFFFFLTRYDERRAHNMLVLMLNLRFKNLILISFFISHEQGVTIQKHQNENVTQLLKLTPTKNVQYVMIQNTL